MLYFLLIALLPVVFFLGCKYQAILDKAFQDAKIEKIEANYSKLLSRSERDMLSTINGLQAQNKYLETRIQDLQSDINAIRTAKDNSDNALIQVVTSLQT